LEPPADAHGFAAVYAAPQRKSGAGNALISVSLDFDEGKLDSLSSGMNDIQHAVLMGAGFDPLYTNAFTIKDYIIIMKKN
ncbi:MAG: hypothetical protein HFH06_16345, partial [Lachnospiraceae bacterium]|nr:hypothetical protein [Lachnospiraceae bacterium]